MKLILQNLLGLGIPIVLSVYLYPFLKRVNYLKNSNPLFIWAFSTSLGSALLIVFLSTWSMFIPTGFKEASQIYFLICCLIVLCSVQKVDILLSFKTIKKNVSQYKLVSFLIFFYIFLYGLIFILRPVVDSDVTEAYLPLARTIIKENRLPVRNHYDNTAFIIPPAGGPIYFAFFYAILSDTESEAFRFFNMPIFLGFIILSYYFFKNYLSKKNSLVALVILLSIPLIEDTVFLTGLYPDLLAAFIILNALYILQLLISDYKKFYSVFFQINLGLSLAATLLIKYQQIFIWILFFFFYVLLFLKGKLKYIGLLCIFFPDLLVLLTGGNSFKQYPQIVYIIYYLSLVVVGLYAIRKFKSTNIPLQKNILISILIALLGTLFIIRTYFIFGGFQDKSYSLSWFDHIHVAAGVNAEGGSLFNIILPILGPVFSSLLVIPKLIGLFRVRNKKRLLVPFLVLVIFYIWWVLYLGGTTVRWLLPILPVLTIFIVEGVESISFLKNRGESVILADLLFSLFSSKFIFWNLSTLLIGVEKVRKIGANIVHVNQPIFYKILIDFIYVLTSRAELTSRHIWILLFLSIIPFVIVCKIINYKKITFIFYSIPLFIIICYGYFFIKVSNGNLLNFGKNESRLLFNYWGQDLFITPYIKAHAEQKDITIAFTEPTGLAYFTGHKVYNMEGSSSIKIFYPIYNESDVTKIYNYYKQKNIRFVVIRTYGNSEIVYQNLKKDTHIFDIIENKIYFRKIISPHDDNLWYLYEII